MKQLMLVTLCKNCKFCNHLPLLGKEYYECTIDPDELTFVEPDHYCSYGDEKDESTRDNG